MAGSVAPIRFQVPKEIGILLACVRRGIGSIRPDELNSLLRTEVDWSAAAEAMRRHRLVGPALSGLLLADADLAPAPVLASLKADRVVNAIRSLFLAGQLIEVLKLLDSNDIPALSFKGPVLSADAYGDPAIRAAGDLDLLVLRQDIAAARELLMARGFVPVFPTSSDAEASYLRALSGKPLERYLWSHSEHHFMRESSRVNIDLHWDITLRRYGLAVDLQPLWDNFRYVQVGEASIRALGLEETLLVLCLNAAKDCWSRLDQICDVAALIHRNRGMSFEVLFEAARRAGTTRMVLITLLLARSLLHVALPPRVTQRIAEDRHCRRLAEEFAERILDSGLAGRETQSRLEQTSAQLRVRDGLASRLRYLIGQCYPTVGDWAAVRLPQSLSFLYVALRPIRLMFQPEGKATR